MSKRRRAAHSEVRLTLLTRAYCHLCDEMLAAVRPIAASYAVPIDMIDVDADPALEAAYGELVPVLFAGSPTTGTELCRYRLDAGRVAAALAAALADLGARADRSRAGG